MPGAFWIGTSWKMNKTLGEALDFARVLRGAEHDPAINHFVIPPFTAVREVKKELKDTGVRVGAQNMHWAESGPWTGEISPVMLTDCGLDMVELGHSERRAHFGETDETVGLKAAAAVRHGLIPLICLGETAEDKAADRADAVLAAQVRAALGGLTADETRVPILLAYEPVWAIGEGGVPATPDYATRRHAGIAETAHEVSGRPIPCLYGGSVNAGNCAELAAAEHVEGLFVGRAAWTPQGYLDIVARCAGCQHEGVER